MTGKFDLDADFVRKLAALLQETGLNEIEFAEGEKRIRLSRAAATAMIAHAAPTIPSATSTAPDAALAAKKQSEGHLVAAPMVGTVYLSPEPGSASFIKVGDKVKPGDTLLIIEAMKVMNPIKSTIAGIVKEIMVSDAKPVEFGEALVVIG